MGWFANALLIVGLVLIGKKYRHAFMFTLLGEVIWVGVCLERGVPFDFTAICLVFAGLAAWNWYQWNFTSVAESAADE